MWIAKKIIELLPCPCFFFVFVFFMGPVFFSFTFCAGMYTSGVFDDVFIPPTHPQAEHILILWTSLQFSGKFPKQGGKENQFCHSRKHQFSQRLLAVLVLERPLFHLYATADFRAVFSICWGNYPFLFGSEVSTAHSDMCVILSFSLFGWL